MPRRKERLDRLDGMVAGGPTGERKEQLSLTHRLHTNVHAGAQTKWRPGRLHAQPQNQAVHCGLRAPPHWRTKAVPQDGHRSRAVRQSSGVSLKISSAILTASSNSFSRSLRPSRPGAPGLLHHSVQTGARRQDPAGLVSIAGR